MNLQLSYKTAALAACLFAPWEGAELVTNAAHAAHVAWAEIVHPVQLRRDVTSKLSFTFSSFLCKQ